MHLPLHAAASDSLLTVYPCTAVAAAAAESEILNLEP